MFEKLKSLKLFTHRDILSRLSLSITDRNEQQLSLMLNNYHDVWRHDVNTDIISIEHTATTTYRDIN